MPNSVPVLPAYDHKRGAIVPRWKLEGSAVVDADDGPDDAPDVVEPHADGPFDPSAHTIDEVKAHVEAYPDNVEAVYDAEVDGKNRVTLVDWLTNFANGD